MAAFDCLQAEYNLVYVPTKHNSDENINFNHLRTSTESSDRDAALTLNMLKIKDYVQTEPATMWNNFTTKEEMQIAQLFS